MTYTPDQKRVSDYIQEMTDGAIGGGDDPIGFLIASHTSLFVEAKSWRETLRKERNAVLVNDRLKEHYKRELARANELIEELRGGKE